MIAARRLVIGIAAALSLGLAAAPASAKQVYDYTYSGQFIDGSASTKGTFTSGLSAAAFDATAERLLVAVDANPGYITKFTKAGVPDPFGAPGLTDAVNLPGELGSPAQIAVNNTGNSDDGNFYVVGSNFSSLAGFKRDGTPLPAFGSIDRNRLCGIAVDPQGYVWLAKGDGFDNHAILERYTAEGAKSGVVLDLKDHDAVCRIAIDSGGDFYGIEVSGGLNKVVKLSQSGKEFYELVPGQAFGPSTTVAGLAVDQTTDEVFVSQGFSGSVISYYDSDGAKLGTFGAPDPSHSFDGLEGFPLGIAFDPATRDVWISNRRDYGGGVRHLERFERSAPITVPTATTAAPDHEGTSAVLKGTLNADGIETTNCHFDWGTSQLLGKTIPCAEGPFADSDDHPVSAHLGGLKKGTTYYYRLSSNNANGRVSTGGPVRFIAQAKPIIGSVYANQVNTDGSRLNGEVNPNGGNTTFHFEWGTEEGVYTASSPESDPFGLLDSEIASYVVTGLNPATTYHYRVVVTNEAGTTLGEDGTFITYALDSGTDPCANSAVRQQTGTALLLDCRAYELVSAANAGGYDVESDLIPGQEPLVSSPVAKDRLLYSIHAGSIPGVTGNPTNYGRDPYLAKRTGTGWSTEYAGLPANGMEQEGSFGSPLLESDSSLSQFAFGGQGICDPCFDDGSINIPLRRADGRIEAGMTGTLKPSLPINSAGVVGKHFSTDGSHFIFSTPAKLELAGKNGLSTVYDRNLETGVTQVVSTLPSGQVIKQGKGGELGVSGDGSRILVGERVGTDAKGNELWHPYLHIGTSPNSVDLAPGATSGVYFSGMTEDGSRFFFSTVDQLLLGEDTDESADLYEAIVDSSGMASLRLVSVGQGGPSNDDSCEPPGVPNNWNAAAGQEGKCNVLAFAGGAGLASENGTFYFLSPELLDGPTDGEANQANLYVVKPGESPGFVATMDSATGEPGPETGVGLIKTFGSFPTSRVFMAVDNSGGVSDGDLYVADPEAGVVKKFDSEGNPLTAWGAGGVLDGSTASGGPFGNNVSIPFSQQGCEGPCGIVGIAIDPVGNLVVRKNLKKFQAEESPLGRKALTYKFAADGTPIGSYETEQRFNPVGIALSASGEVGYGVNFNGNASVDVMSWPVTGGGFPPTVVAGNVHITGLASDPATGDLYVSREGGTLQHYTDGGAKVWETTGFTGLSALAVNPSNQHLFASLGNRVVELDADGEQVGKVFGTGVLNKSLAVAFGTADTHIYVSNANGSKIAIFTPVPTAWRPIDNPAISHAAEDPATHRFSDFQVSPDGRYAAFGSTEPLRKGFANFDHEEVYRYDAEVGQLDCASCAPTGASPSSDTALSPYGLNLSDDGRVFFTSVEPFVLRDTNQRRDAYEWSDGAVQLISTGQSSSDSTLLSVSADGADAFFFTRQVLVSGDENGNAVKVYDAREGGGFLYEPPPFPCAASDECHGAGTQAPPAPRINTVTGAGPQGAKSEACRKGYVKRNRKCVKKPRKRPQRKQRSAKTRGSK